MVGNVTTYELNMKDIIEMLWGNKLPRPMKILSSIIAVTYIRTTKLPKTWLKSTFRVRHRVVLQALHWLIANNHHYHKYEVDEDLIASMLEDDVPVEILAAVRQEEDTGVIEAEKDGYVPELEETNQEPYVTGEINVIKKERLI